MIFSSCGHGKIIDELDFARVFVSGWAVADMCPNFLSQDGIWLDAVVGNNKGFDDFRVDWVRFFDGSGQQDGGMLQQEILDFAGTDTVSRTGDDIVVTAHEPNIAVPIGLAHIACQKPIAKKFIGGGL